MSRPSDAFNSELDYLWHVVGEAQDASARSEAERADARKGLSDTSAKALRLERELAESLERERRLRTETESLKSSINKDAETLALAARQAREAAGIKAVLIKKESETALFDVELTALRAEAGSLREALTARDAAIESFKERMAGLMSLPELARALKEDSEASGKPASAYEELLERVEKGKRASEAAAAELASASERGNAFKASLAASEEELSALRLELARKGRELAALEAALGEAASKADISAGEKASLEGRAAALKAALAEKETALKTAISDCAVLRAEMDASRFEAEKLRQASDEHALRAQEQRSNFSGAVAQVFELQKRAAALKSALGQAQEQNAALALELKGREADMEKVNGLLRDAKNGLATEKETARR
ncbi:MAG: hypothetical protein Q8O90_05940, partial [Elusimicrobiota bacterium]|nr:hypothetical protein [Elusimicrobiota bacterium]